jgi:hypothetical protein
MSQAGVVTMKAMVQRLNRRLERDSKVLRSPRGDVDRSRFGNYFIVDTIRNVVVHAHASSASSARGRRWSGEHDQSCSGRAHLKRHIEASHIRKISRSTSVTWQFLDGVSK